VQGIGECGTVGGPAAFVNAVVDAIAHLGVRNIDMPCLSGRVWEAIKFKKDVSGHSSASGPIVARVKRGQGSRRAGIEEGQGSRRGRDRGSEDRQLGAASSVSSATSPGGGLRGSGEENVMESAESNEILEALREVLVDRLKVEAER